MAVVPTKILLDENLSYKLKIKFSDIFLEIEHCVNACGYEAKDFSIWNFAKNSNYAILTKDEDFKDLSLLYGQPPKVILLKTGNCNNHSIEVTVRQHLPEIEEFIQDNEKSLLILSE